MTSMAVREKLFRKQTLVVLVLVSICSITIDGKFVYRYNPVGGELKYLPNSPPIWDKSASLHQMNTVRCKNYQPFSERAILRKHEMKMLMSKE